MNKVIRLLCAVAAMGVGWRVMGAADASLEAQDMSVDSVRLALDLSAVFDRVDLTAIEIGFSASGWGLDATDAGRTVTLSLRNEDTGATTVIASGLVGVGAYSWSPVGVEAVRYTILHTVVDGDVPDLTTQLTGALTFENCKSVVSKAGLDVALMLPSSYHDFEYDILRPWLPIDGEGDGICSPVGGDTEFSVIVDSDGFLEYEWMLSAGVMTVLLDGQVVKEYNASDAWTAESMTVESVGGHKIAFEISGAEGVARLKAMRWKAPDVQTLALSTSRQPLDLSSVWDRTDLSTIPVAYSTVGWDLQADDGTGRTVSLTLERTAGGTASTLVEGLSGQGIYSWTPSNIENIGYTLRHVVYAGNGMPDPNLTLTANFNFENVEVLVNDDMLCAAMMMPSQACEFEYDSERPWRPISGEGCGICAPDDGNTEFGFAVSGKGALDFKWALDAGEMKVYVDGCLTRTFVGPADWTSERIAFDAFSFHKVVFRVEEANTGARLDDVRWGFGDDAAELADDAAGVRVDLREGVRVVRRRENLLPFVYSSTNFTGVAGATDESVSHVRVVQVRGETMEDWTNTVNEVSSSETLLLKQPKRGEGQVLWNGKRGGIWKAEFLITTGTETNHLENAFFDMNRFPVGLVILLN